MCLWWWIHVPISMIKLHRIKHTHMCTHTCTHTPQFSTSKTEDIWIRSVGCINVPILVVILYWILQDVSTGGNWVKSVKDLSLLVLTSACERERKTGRKEEQTDQGVRGLRQYQMVWHKCMWNIGKKGEWKMRQTIWRLNGGEFSKINDRYPSTAPWI